MANGNEWQSLPMVAEWQLTDAKPRAEGACTLCRGAKEEDRRSMAKRLSLSTCLECAAINAIKGEARMPLNAIKFGAKWE